MSSFWSLKIANNQLSTQDCQVSQRLKFEVKPSIWKVEKRGNGKGLSFFNPFQAVKRKMCGKCFTFYIKSKCIANVCASFIFTVVTRVRWISCKCNIHATVTSKYAKKNVWVLFPERELLEYGCQFERLRLRGYAPTSSTASHDNHKKTNSWVSFSFQYGFIT